MFEPEILHFQNAEDESRDIASGMYIHVYIYNTSKLQVVLFRRDQSNTSHRHTYGW